MTKELLQNYVELMDAYEGSEAHLLYKLNLMSKEEFNNILSSGQYCKTGIKFSDYKKAMLNYVSEDLFNEKFAKLYNKSNDANEYLHFQPSGASVGTNKIENIEYKGNQKESSFIATVYQIHSDGTKGDTYNVEFTIETFMDGNNKKRVISYCDELKY